MVKLEFKHLACSLANGANILLIINNIFHFFVNSIWIILSFDQKPPLFYLHLSHWSLGYASLWCPHGSEFTRTHDVIHNVFASIEKEIGYHMVQEKLLVLFFPMRFKHSNIMWMLFLRKMRVKNTCRHCHYWSHSHSWKFSHQNVFYKWLCNIINNTLKKRSWIIKIATQNINLSP